MRYLPFPVFLTLLLAGPAMLTEGAEPSGVHQQEDSPHFRELDWCEEKGRRFDLNPREAEIERDMDHVKRELEKQRFQLEAPAGEKDEDKIARARSETQRLKETMARDYFEYAKELGKRDDLSADERGLRKSALRDRGRRYEQVFRDFDHDLRSVQELARKAAETHEPFGGQPVAKEEVAPSAATEPADATDTSGDELPQQVSIAK